MSETKYVFVTGGVVSGLGKGIVGDRVYGIPGGPMLLHARRLLVPRAGKPPIDVTAPLPPWFEGWDDAA